MHTFKTITKTLRKVNRNVNGDSRILSSRRIRLQSDSSTEMTNERLVEDALGLVDRLNLSDECEVEGDSGISEIRNPHPKWIKLNVGGKLFITSYNTIAQKEPNMLSRMFAHNLRMNPSDTDDSGAYLLDRSPEYFEVILNYMRHGKLICNNNINPEGVLEEARFFGVESLIPELQAIVEREKNAEMDLPLVRQDVVRALIQTNTMSELRFQGVNLAGADLRRLDLRKINFKYANLSHCNLSFSNMSNCSLERADLSHANLESALLISVRGLCANMESSSMKNANFEDPTGRNLSNMEGVNLKNACLEGANMAGINLRVANLKYANMKNCNLRGAVLAGADLEVNGGVSYLDN